MKKRIKEERDQHSSNMGLRGRGAVAQRAWGRAAGVGLCSRISGGRASTPGLRGGVGSGGEGTSSVRPGRQLEAPLSWSTW